MVALGALFLSLLSSTTALLDISRPDSKVARNVLEGKSEGYCSPSGPIESTNCQYENVEALNSELFPALHDLVEHPFFKYYKVDLYRECPFWQDNGFCMNRACGVEEAKESDIPEKWRSHALSEVRIDEEDDGVNSCSFRDDDFCYIEDDATPEGQYIDLTLNPERFTGYAGDSAHDVWRAIYKENCFGLSEAALEAARNPKSTPARSVAPGLGGGAGFGLDRLSEGYGTEMIKHPFAPEDMCEEKKLYYRLVSGLHASISIHICADYLDQTTGEWAPNLDCFISRLATHPERLSNVYFNHVLLMRAVARAAPYFRAYDIGVAPKGKENECTRSQRKTDAATRKAFNEVLALAERTEVATGFSEAAFFRGPDAPILKEQFKSHFRNVSRIMDCVGCDKCRLWGKLQVSGFGTALKILFALDERDLDSKINPDLLQRSEVVALFNSLHRISESLNSVEDFRRIYAKTQADEARAAVERARRDAEERARKAREEREAALWYKISQVAAGVISAFEAMRRSCTGCWEGLWRLLKGGVEKVEL